MIYLIYTKNIYNILLIIQSVLSSKNNKLLKMTLKSILFLLDNADWIISEIL